MKKLYIAAALFLSINGIAAQTTATQTSLSNKNYLSNNQGDADEFYRNNDDNRGFFQFPVNDRSAYNRLVEREMASHRLLGNEQQNSAAAGLDFDVKYYRLYLRINPDSAAGKYVRGNVTTYFTTLADNLSEIKFDFASELICDSVYYHGVKLAAGSKVEDVDTLKITVPIIVTSGTLDSVTVYYRGVPRVVPDFSGATGFVKSTHSGQNFIYTLSEPYSAFTWWPCKSRVTSDKADSLDIIVSTPSGFKVAANGIVAAESVVATTRTTYWKHRYPISSYQVAIAVANYQQYPSTPTMVNINGTNMPFYNYLFPETNTATARTALDRTPLMLTTFSSKFGDYPFKNEKYGHYTFGFGGGMEHNTFSGMGAGTYNATNAWNVISHELAHQWWGASVTCGSWRDIWVNEGFARYSEIISAEFAPTTAPGTTAAAHRAGFKSTAISTANQAKSIYQNDTTTMTTIFSPAVYIYDRGAMVISMLRTLMGDTKFFQALQNYQADPLLKNKHAFTDDVKRHMQDASGLDLEEFFNDWIYNTGFANYNTAKWNNSGNQLVLLMPQTTQLSGISHFDMPLVVRVQGSNPVTMDTTLILFDKQGVLNFVNNGVLTSTGVNMVQVALSFTPTTVSFDPFSQVLANGSIAKDPALVLLANNEINFNGRKDGKNVLLSWDIDPSFEYGSFELQKSSGNEEFNTISTVKKADNPGKYIFNHTDYNVTARNTYYRIKVLQNNGSYIYSKTVSISNLTREKGFVISPNPVSNMLNIQFTGSWDIVLNAGIYDANGRLVKKASGQAVSLNSKWKIDVSDLVPGNYFVEIESSNKQKLIQKVIIINK